MKTGHSELTNNDVLFVLSRVPKDIRALMQKNRIFLAGGFIRAVIAGELPSDIDLLGGNKDRLIEIGKAFAEAREARTYLTKNAMTVLKPPRIAVQFILRWTYDDPVKLIDEFDFTIVQAAIWWDSSDTIGRFRSVCSGNFYADLAARRLVYTQPERHEDAGGSILRVIKYVKRGYNIQPESLCKVIARLAKGLRIHETDSFSFDKEGNEILREEWAAPILTSLMREVDPLFIVDGVEFSVDQDNDVPGAEE